MTAKDPSREKTKASTMFSTNGSESSTVLVSWQSHGPSYVCIYVTMYVCDYLG